MYYIIHRILVRLINKKLNIHYLKKLIMGEIQKSKKITSNHLKNLKEYFKLRKFL